jgi:hypothetical protein
MRNILLTTVAVIAVAACAGRDPQMVQIVQPMDQHMDCNAINAEVYANNVRIQQLQTESSNTTGKNIAFGVVGAILFWPALFAMDFKDGAGKDAQALQARQGYLASLMASKRCTPGLVG